MEMEFIAILKQVQELEAKDFVDGFQIGRGTQHQGHVMDKERVASCN